MASPAMASVRAFTSAQPARCRRNTLEILRRLIAVLWIADAVLLTATLVGVTIHRAGLQTVGRDSAPSIIAAQHVKTALADMDAETANGLLIPPGQGEAAITSYEARRQEAAGALISAAENITYGEVERKPIRTLQLGLGTYEARVQKARDLYERHDAGFLAVYKQAVAVMDSTLLPAADELDQANLKVLESVYESQSTRSLLTRGLVLVTAILLLYSLLSVQVFLSRKMNRTLNLPLVAATLLTLGWAGWATTTLSSEQRLLKTAREDAFRSMHALWRARAAAYSANSDESRYLLDKPGAVAHEADFRAKVALLVKLPEGRTTTEVAQASRMSHKTEGFAGYLADELNNITFSGERDAAVQTLLDFGEYVRIDSQIRDRERAGKHAEAIALCIGRATGESNWAFDRFDKSLGATLDINQKAFDEAVKGGFDQLNHFELKTSVAAVVLALLMFLGLMQRMAEYR